MKHVHISKGYTPTRYDSVRRTIGFHQSHSHFEDGRFSAPAGPEKAHPLAWMEVKGNSAQDLKAAKSFFN